MKRLLAAVALVALTACVPPAPVAAVDLGPGRTPTVDQARDAVFFCATQALRDPMSVLFRNIKVGPIDTRVEPTPEGGRLIRGWTITFEVNAKNSAGDYVGFQKASFVWREGKESTWMGGHCPAQTLQAD